MDGIWTWLMGLIYERHMRLQKGVIVNAILTLFEECKIKAQRYKVFPSRNGIYQIQIPHSGIKYTVKLKKAWCSCSWYIEYKIPYTYAIIALQHEKEDPFKREYTCGSYTTAIYRECYSSNVSS
jgi:hypothetical protein